MIKPLRDYQYEAVQKMHNGCVLVGGVGSGKTLTSLVFVYTKWLGGVTPCLTPDKYSEPTIKKDVYVITTARKRDSRDWQDEADNIVMGITKTDSWNNIHKYTHIKDAIFIFDETHILGYGSWTQSFLKIASKNKWILLSATPADSWMDFMPVFIANGYYKNKTEFVREHVIYSRYSKYPKVERYINVRKLIRIKNEVVVNMLFNRHTIPHHIYKYCAYDAEKYKKLSVDRWNIYDKKPLKDAGQLCFYLRKLVNSDKSRLDALDEIFSKHDRLIIFYSFDYELFILREWCKNRDHLFSEWNGHAHYKIPEGPSWIYLCQYSSASEAWNAITTNCVVFFSQTYSYRTMVQASGRIDRMNTKFINLYYYHLLSNSSIDKAIENALKTKQNFNESKFLEAL